MSVTLIRPDLESLWTVDDLAGLPEGYRYEIFDGSLIVSPHADVPHGGVVNRLHRVLNRQAPADLLVGGTFGVSRQNTSYFVPDLLVVPDAALRKGGKALHPADVLLVVEVLSPGNAGRDLVVKRHEYALAGIPRYWVVDQKQQTITVLRLVAGRYVEAARLRPGESWRTDEPFPLALDPVEVF